jgi:glycosyltransferase involved in cell wall biosynthesis
MRILISAYACEPHKGSEPAVGWGWVLQAARSHEVWVITRSSNEPDISAYLVRSPLPNVHWVYHDLPRWARFWKKGNRGVHPYYYLWQIGAFLIARRLYRHVRFDVMHHATFVNYWLPSFLGFLPIPLVWGPVGGGESAPGAFYRTFSLRGRLYEHLRDLVRGLAAADPVLRSVAPRSAVPLATTPETAAVLRRLGCRDVRAFSQVALGDQELASLARLPVRNDGPFRAVSIGRLLHWKGFDLGLKAFADLVRDVPDAEYWVLGDGPERGRLTRLAHGLGVADRVHFLGQRPRQDVLTALGQCDVLLHPSLHDSGGFVCLEALAAGRPVVCLDLGGPAVIVSADCGYLVPADDPERVPAEIAAALHGLARDPGLRRRLGAAGRERAAELFCWDGRGAVMDGFYALAAARRTGSPKIPA